MRVKLQQQPFQALAVLLERPGEVVTREELQKRLWPDDTVGDFDRGLTKAIARVRDALGDDADNPRFIETLPQRGYRFLAPVEINSVGPAAVSSGLPQTREAPLSDPKPGENRLVSVHLPWRRAGIAVLALLVVAGGIAVSRR